MQNNYEKEVLKCKQLKKDISDLQLLLHQARVALNKEIAFKSTMERYPNHMVRTDLLPDPMDIRYEDHYRNSSRKLNAVFRKIPDASAHNLAGNIYNTDDEDESNILSKIEPIDLRDVSPLREYPQNTYTKVDSHQQHASDAENGIEQTEDEINEDIQPNKVSKEKEIDFPRPLDFHFQEKSEKINILEDCVSEGNETPFETDKIVTNICSHQLDEETHSNLVESDLDGKIQFDQENIDFPYLAEPLETDLGTHPEPGESALQRETQTFQEPQIKDEPSAPFVAEENIKQDLSIKSEPKKPDIVLSKLDLLEKDPILQKYMDMIAEKRKENTSMIDPEARLDSFTAKLEVLFIPFQRLVISY